MPVNFKKFDGKRYEIEYRTENERLANKLARRLRQSGRNARVTKHVKTEFCVYKR